MKISNAWLQTYFDKPLPAPDRLAELFNIHFAEVEGMEKVALSDGGTDTVFDIKTLADRNHYALCHRGIAGEVAAMAKMALKAPVEPKIGLEAAVQKVAVNVTDPKKCPRYAARRVEGVKVGPSPKWLRDRLEAIGARSINSVVDATNFVMFDIGQPLHAFDAAKVKGAISVRAAKPGEKITLLDGREVELLESDLLIADDEAPLAIAGVKGGKRAEVTENTKSVIIEAANFNPTTVRRTSTRLNLRNDSSKRFENEITSALAGEAIERVTALVVELSKSQGADAKAGAVTDAYPNPVKPWTVDVSVPYMNDVTGLSLSANDMADILERLSCGVERRAGKDSVGEVLFVTPPLERLDLTIPEDFADEIARTYGYDKLESKDTPAVPAMPIDKTFYWTEFLRNALTQLGYSEVQTYTLVKKGAFEISHPLASDKAALREKIVPKLSEALTQNALHAELLGLDVIKIFEIGKVFPKAGERTHVAIGAVQVKKKKGVTSESVLKEAIAAHESRFGPLKEKIETGPFGAIVEIDLDAVVEKLETGKFQDLDFKPLSRDIKYRPFSPYPYIVRDVALFVPAGTNDAAVSNVIKEAASAAAGNLLVKGPDIFDRFEKDGKVSYAFRMIFQSFEKTLSDEEANAFMATIYSAAKGKGWEVR